MLPVIVGFQNTKALQYYQAGPPFLARIAQVMQSKPFELFIQKKITNCAISLYAKKSIYIMCQNKSGNVLGAV